MSEINHWYELVAFVVLGVGFVYLLYGNYMARKVCGHMNEALRAMLDRIKVLEDQAYLRAPYYKSVAQAPVTPPKENPYESLLQAELDLEERQTPPEERT